MKPGTLQMVNDRKTNRKLNRIFEIGQLLVCEGSKSKLEKLKKNTVPLLLLLMTEIFKTKIWKTKSDIYGKCIC